MAWVGWKSYVGGVATALGIGGFTYFLSEVGYLRGESVIGSAEVDDVTVRVIRQDKKWCFDDYRIEVVDGEGEIRVKFQSSGHMFQRGEFTDKNGLETSIEMD